MPWVQTKLPGHVWRKRVTHRERRNVEEMSMKEDKVTSAGLHPGFGGGNLSLRAVRGVPKMLEPPFALPQHGSEGHIGTVMVEKVRDEVCGCFSLRGRRRVKLHQYLAGDAKKWHSSSALKCRVSVKFLLWAARIADRASNTVFPKRQSSFPSFTQYTYSHCIMYLQNLLNYWYFKNVF